MDAVGTIPSTDELSRVDYCGNMVYDRGERRLLLENGFVTFDLQTGLPDSPYATSMTNLFYFGYNDKDYKTAVNNFFSGSLGGDIYKEKLGYKIGTIKENPLIKAFFFCTARDYERCSNDCNYWNQQSGLFSAGNYMINFMFTPSSDDNRNDQIYETYIKEILKGSLPNRNGVPHAGTGHLIVNGENFDSHVFNRIRKINR